MFQGGDFEAFQNLFDVNQKITFCQPKPQKGQDSESSRSQRDMSLEPISLPDRTVSRAHSYEQGRTAEDAASEASRQEHWNLISTPVGNVPLEPQMQQQTGTKTHDAQKKGSCQSACADAFQRRWKPRAHLMGCTDAKFR